MTPVDMTDLARFAEVLANSYGQNYVEEQEYIRTIAARAAAEAEAMRAPITIDALTADGWAEDTGKFGGTQYMRVLGANTHIEVWFANYDPVIAVVSMGRSVYVAGITTMHDLGELVRLLEGAQ